MIPNQWYPILQTSEIQREKPTGVRRMGEELVLWRDLDGTLVCQTARCPHKGANIGDGRLKGNTVECPYHGFRFDAEGTCKVVPALGAGARIPASLKLRTYPVREQHGLVWLWWGRSASTSRRSNSPPNSSATPVRTRRSRGPGPCTTPATSKACSSSTT